MVVSALVAGSRTLRRRFSLRIVGVALCVCSVLSVSSGCSVERLVVLSDHVGDDYGPGQYRYPNHPAFSSGSFDLKKVALSRSGEDWIVEVSFSRKVEQALVFLERDEKSTLQPQMVDLYFNFSADLPVYQEALPGRAIVFDAGGGWQKALVLSPVPLLLRRALKRTTKNSQDVFVPAAVRVSGRKIRARVPVSFLGESLPRSMAVLVLGTRFKASFDLVDRVRSVLSPEGLAMDVKTAAGQCNLDDDQGFGCSFSGCSPCGSHPRVIDILDPDGAQKKLLSNYNPESGRFAHIRMIPVVPGAAASARGD